MFVEYGVEAAEHQIEALDKAQGFHGPEQGVESRERRKQDSHRLEYLKRHAMAEGYLRTRAANCKRRNGSGRKRFCFAMLSSPKLVWLKHVGEGAKHHGGVSFVLKPESHWSY